MGVGAGMSTKANFAPPRGPGYTRQGVRGVGGGVTVIVKLHMYHRARPTRYLSTYRVCEHREGGRRLDHGCWHRGRHRTKVPLTPHKTARKQNHREAESSPNIIDSTHLVSFANICSGADDRNC